MPTSPAQDRPDDPTTRTLKDPLPLVSEADLVHPTSRVVDVMTAAPRTCTTFSTVLEAVMIFRDAECGVVPIVDGDGKPAGVLTDRDVALALPEHETDLASMIVTDLMARDVVTIEADATLKDVLDRITAEGLRRLMVVDSEGRLVGVLSLVDLVPHVSERALGRIISEVARHRGVALGPART